MKKILFFLIVFCSLGFSGEMVYSTKVKSVYLDEVKSKVAGRLLPTNKIEILEKNGDLVKFKIQGYQNPAAKNVVYYSDGSRILALAFAKTATPDIEVEKLGKDGGWNEVSVVAYTIDGDFVTDVNPLFEKAKASYNENCSMCHALHDVNQYNANQWPSLFKSMAGRTPIHKDDYWSIIQYLQKHTTAK